MGVDSLESVQSGYHSHAGGPAVPGALGTTILNKILGIPCFSGTEREKDTVHSNSGITLFQMLKRFLMSNW